MEKVDVFESFIEAVSGMSRNQTILTANSFYLIDDEKQRGKMTEEFYLAVKKEIAEYQERADYLIKRGSNSPAIMERWVLKIQQLEQKKRHYEDILRRELDGLDDEFDTLKFLSQELSIRANSLRYRKAAWGAHMEYDVIITETLRKTVSISADSVEDALELVEEQWNNEVYVLDYTDFVRATFEVK